MSNRNKTIIKAAGILVVGILLGWLIFGGENNTNEDLHEHGETAGVEIWTCSMHPQIRQNEPGDCPICGMDLIPLEITNGGDTGVYTMSENAMKLSNIQTMTVGKGDASKEIRLNGKVEVDERNTYSQSTHIPGRIEDLAINFTGEEVKRGQTLATIYSPELVTAQAELLQAAAIKESQPELFAAAKDKLKNWKISQSQIDQILSGGKALERFSIRADVNGIVTEKMVDLGDYVDRGMPIYEISDLSKVWVLFDLYESQLGWVKEGSEVEYTVNSIPGETFEGKIEFIDPFLNSQTRVSTARIVVKNNDGRLKPGMFVSGVVENSVGEAKTDEIVIPKSAVLWTGKRSIVYVKEDVNGQAGFKLREITLGPELGDAYVVKEGLEPGEEIVTHGTFTVDAAVQLAGGNSMMSPSANVKEGNPALEIEISEATKAELKLVTTDYLELKNSLVADDFSGAKTAASELNGQIEKVKAAELKKDATVAWNSYKEQLIKSSQSILAAANIKEMRGAFDELSNTMIGMVASFRLSSGELYVLHCPMANSDKGADWLSASPEILNPYYGAAMLKCGEVKREIN